MNKTHRLLLMPILIISVLLIVSIGSLIYGVRHSTANQTNCLAFENKVVDLTTRTIFPRNDSLKKVVDTEPDNRTQVVFSAQPLTMIAPDGHSRARIWIAGSQLHLAIGTADHEQFVDLPSTQVINSMYGPGWSKDNRYLAVVASNGQSEQLYIVNAQTLQVQSAVEVGTFSWALEGHRFAYFASNTDLVVSLSEGDTEHFSIPGNGYGAINWSPNSDLMAIITHNTANNQAYELFQYYLINVINGHIQQVNGEYNSMCENGWCRLSTGGTWADNGRDWLYLQQDEPTADYASANNLKITDAQSGQTTTLATYTAQTLPLSPDGAFMAVPSKTAGKIAVTVWNVTNLTHWTLIKGADHLLSGPSWSPDSQKMMTAWSSGDTNASNYQAYLEWANADGTQHHLVNDYFKAVGQFQWRAGNPWVSFTVQHDDYAYNSGSGIEIVNPQTAALRTLLSGLSPMTLGAYDFNNYGGVFPAPDQKNFAILRDEVTMTDDSWLDFVTLDGMRTVTYHSDRISYPRWSAEGSKVAFIIQDMQSSSGAFQLKIVAANGTELWQQALDDGSDVYTPFAWTNCAP